LSNMLALAKDGIRQLIEQQKAVVQK
jgi:hypothetical protein